MAIISNDLYKITTPIEIRASDIALLYSLLVALSTAKLNKIGITIANERYINDTKNLNITRLFDFFKTLFVTSLGLFITHLYYNYIMSF